MTVSKIDIIILLDTQLSNGDDHRPPVCPLIHLSSQLSVISVMNSGLVRMIPMLRTGVEWRCVRTVGSFHCVVTDGTASMQWWHVVNWDSSAPVSG